MALGALLGELDETGGWQGCRTTGGATSGSAGAPSGASAATAPAKRWPRRHPLRLPRRTPCARHRAHDDSRRTRASTSREVPGTGRGGVVSKPDVVEHAARATQRSREPQVRISSHQRPAVPTPAPPSQPAARSPCDAGRHPPHPRSPSARRQAPTARAKRARRCRRAGSASPNTCSKSQHATAHLTTFNEVDMSVVESLRARVKERIEKEQGVRLVLHAVLRARRVPWR